MLFALSFETLALDCLVLVVFAVPSILLIAFGYKFIDWVLGKVDLEEQVQKGNIAAAILSGAIVLGICIVIAAVIWGVLH